MRTRLFATIVLLANPAFAQTDFLSTYGQRETELRSNAHTILEFFLVLDALLLSYVSAEGHGSDFTFPYSFSERLRLISGRTVPLKGWDDYPLAWRPLVVDVPNGFIQFSETRPPGGGGYGWTLALFKAKDGRNFVAVSITHGTAINMEPNFRILESLPPHFRDVTTAVLPRLSPALFRPSACETRIMGHSPARFGFLLPRHGTTVQVYSFVKGLEFSECPRPMGILKQTLSLRWNEDKAIFEL